MRPVTLPFGWISRLMWSFSPDENSFMQVWRRGKIDSAMHSVTHEFDSRNLRSSNAVFTAEKISAKKAESVPCAKWTDAFQLVIFNAPERSRRRVVGLRQGPRVESYGSNFSETGFYKNWAISNLLCVLLCCRVWNEFNSNYHLNLAPRHGLLLSDCTMIIFN